MVLQRSTVCLCLVTLVSVACGPSNVGSKYVKSQQVAASKGAEIAVATNDSPVLAGTTLKVPAGALAKDQQITLELGATNIVSVAADARSPVAVWGPSGLVFSTPVQMTLPVTQGGAVEVLVLEDNGTSSIVASRDITLSADGTRATFAVRGFTRFQVRTAHGCQTNADCAQGQACVANQCQAQCVPHIETCNGLDDDCDGIADNGLQCGDAGVTCTTNAQCGANMVCLRGTCSTGHGLACTSSAQCNASETCVGGTCTASCVPHAETCNGLDDDCDGVIDNGLSCNPTCSSNSQCAQGQVCQNGACVAQCVPHQETCNGADDDCDGVIDNGLSCADAGVDGGVSCTSNSDCARGESCIANTCQVACVPQAETCNGVDDDCDGVVDNGLSSCALDAGPATCTSSAQCGVGEACIQGVCFALCTPHQETCNGLDDDCDGVIDNGLSCGSSDGGSAMSCRADFDCAVGQHCVSFVCQ